MADENRLRILQLEDNDIDAELIGRELQKSDIVFTLRRVQTRDDFIAALTEFVPDLILADYRLPQFDGLTALRIAKERDPDLIFIFVSGAIGEEFAIETLKQGATDYVLKDRMGRLASEIKRALTEAAERRQRREAEEALIQRDRQLETLNSEIVATNRRLKRLALRDPLTGLYNHRYLTEAIELEFFRTRRYAHPFSVIMADIDYFKSINDVYGHLFGDSVLKQLAAQLNKMMRRYDIVGRYGGEEFIMVCPGVDRLKALALAQRLLGAVTIYNFGDKKQSVKLKISVAVVSYPDDRAARAIDLIDIAERILGDAKKAGGNRVYSTLDVSDSKAVALKQSTKASDINLLREKLEKLDKRGKESLVESIFAFAKTIEVRDRGTGEHVEKTVKYAIDIANALGLSREEVENVKQAAVLHDLGKVGISDQILTKKAKLTRREYEVIKRHPQIAADIMRPIQVMHDIIPLILYHHETWDGKGYPMGLKGEEIPIGARIIAIADVYQALISRRPYRKAFSKRVAIDIIKKGAGSQFDPFIVDMFLKIIQHAK